MLAKVETLQGASHLLLGSHVFHATILSSRCLGTGIQLELGIQLQMLACRQLGYQYVVLPADAHIVLTREQHLPCCLHRLASEQLDQRALASAIASQQATDLVARKIQAQIRNGKLAAVHLGHAAHRGAQLGVQRGACHTHELVVI